MAFDEDEIIRMVSNTSEEQKVEQALAASAIPVDVIPDDAPAIESEVASPVYGDRRDFASAGVGRSVRGITHIEDALNAANLNWDIEQVPVTVDGNVLKHRVANIRSDTRDFIEIVSDRYVPFQNRQAYAFLEGIVSSGAMELENAGMFGYDSCFIEARVGKDFTVLHDKVTPYALIKNSHDGSCGVKVCLTPVRVVCRNTLAMALEKSPRIWQVKHLGTIESRMKEAYAVITGAEAYFTELPAMAETMNDINITDKEIVSVLNAMFPLKSDAGTKAQNTVKEAVAEIMTIYLHTEDLKQFRGTAWGFYGAVSDYVTHHAPKETQNWKANRFNRIAEGRTVMPIAQEALLAIAA